MLTAFADIMRGCGFRVVPESCGHDLILIAEEDVVRLLRTVHCMHTGIEPGDVIAVEGKLTHTITLLRQATPPNRRRWASLDDAAADFYLTVTPTEDRDFQEVAAALGVGTACMQNEVHAGRYDNRPAKLVWFGVDESLRYHGDKRLRPSHLNVAVTPGLPSPRALTPWKLAAVRFCLAYGDGREFTRTDMPAPLLVRTFVDQGWAQRLRVDGRVAVYALTDHPRRPDRRFPEIVTALAEELV